jgi:hypothetical protein
VNGVTLEWRAALVPAERSVLAARVASSWRVGEPGGAVQASAGAGGTETVIGRQRGARHEVIRLQEALPGHTRVVVSAIDLSRPIRRTPAPPFPLPDGQVLLSVLESDEPHGTQTFVVHSRSDLPQTEAQLRASLDRSGWVRQGRRDARVGQVYWAVRAGRRLEAVVMRHGAASRLVVQVSSDAAH